MIKIVPYEMPTTLLECPPGLFMFESNGGWHIGFKTEYGRNHPDSLEVYVVDSGEIFWGGVNTKEARARLPVFPCETKRVPT